MHIISVVKKLFQKNQIDNKIQYKFIRHILRERWFTTQNS